MTPPLIPPLLQAKIETHQFILGSDEVGLGSWAGPLSVCAAIAPRSWSMPGVTDSKKLTRTAREYLYPQLIKSITYHVVHMYADEFDSLGAGRAFVEAHSRAITGALAEHSKQGVTETPLCIIDGIRSVLGSYTLPKADALLQVVGAASIVAKVQHDRIMDELDRQYPGYDLSSSAGYGTTKHLTGLTSLGPSPAHRMTYAPMRKMSRC
jgi:ribonuclease HII